MKKIKFNEHVLPHLIAVIAFFVITVVFFSPVFFDNKVLSQHDITQHTGVAKELRDYRAQTGEEGLWAESLFSGMPAYLVSVEWSDSPVIWLKQIASLFLPHPINNIFLSILCYYLMLLAFGVRPYLAMAGAVAFGLSSFFIIGLGAGHNARIGAMAFMPLVLAGIHLVFRDKKILGFGVTAAALALQLRENHLQVTYYLLLIVLGYGLMQLVLFIRDKKIVEFAKIIGVLVVAAVLAVGTAFGPLWAVSEYSRYSARGASELQRPVKSADSEGLSKSYAFRYSNGILEPMTLMVPNFYGGSSMQSLVADQSSTTYKALVQSGDNQLANQLANYASAYWGSQPLAAPYYAGAIICFLFLIGIVLAEKKYVAWLVSIAVLGIILSWGSSFEAFNYAMFDYFPGYNKFRSVTFALILSLVAMPLLGMLGVEQLFEKGLTPLIKKRLLIAFSLSGGVCLLLILFGGMAGFTKAGEERLPAWFLSAMRDDRAGLLRADAFRSLAFITVVFALLFLDLRKRMTEFGVCALIVFLVTMDVSFVDKRYFTKDNYQRKNNVAQFGMWESEKIVLKDPSHYRVYAEFNDARPSYYFHSIGGYHGAILRRYQDLMDSVLYRETDVLARDFQQGKPLYSSRLEGQSMLNMKYVVYGERANEFGVNKFANGPAWFVKELAAVNSPTEELKKVREINTLHTAVIDQSKFKVQPPDYDSLSSINFLEYKPAYLKYESHSAVNGLAVFSEIYYEKGWHATIDGTEVPILRADYVLRALEVPAGKHIIEFKFAPKPYTIGNKVTLVSSWVLVLALLGSLVLALKKSDES